jgi:tetratricopeptide (TPR) repeat protein
MKKLLSFLFLFCLQIGFSQDLKLMDSLLLALKASKEDTIKVKVLFSLSENCEVQDVLKYAGPMLRLAQKLNFKKGIADANNNIGFYYSTFSKPEVAMKYFNESLQVQQEIGNMQGIASCLSNMALIYRNQGQIEKALDLQIKSLKIKEKIGDKNGTVKCLNSIGSICEEQGQEEEAMAYFMRAMRMSMEVGNEQEIVSSLTQIGALYSRQGKLDEALKYYTKSLKISEKSNDKVYIACALNGIGVIYDEKMQLEKSLECFIRVTQLSEEVNDKRAAAHGLINIGGYYLKKDRFGEAQPYLKRALDMGKEIGNVEIQSHASARLSFAYAKNGDYEKAYESLVWYKTMSDSLHNGEVQKVVLKKQLNYEFEKKQDSLRAEQGKKDAIAKEQGKVKNMQIFGLSGLFLVAVVIGWLVFRQSKLRMEQKNMLIEQKLLRVQMNPHFIFNSLQAIQKFILKQDPKEAAKYLSSFAALTRSVLESSRMELIPLNKEIVLLEHYMRLQKLRFGNRFEYEIHVDGKLDPVNTDIPPMLSQPFIENALEHGMRDIESGGKIDVYFKEENDKLLLEIRDNGNGIHEPASGKKHNSLATTITKERIELMNKRRSKKTTLTFSEAYPEEKVRKGLLVRFSIPL